MKSTLLSKHLTEYFEVYLPQAKGCSVNTIHSYLDAFSLLFQFIEKTFNIPQYLLDYKHLNGNIIENYLYWLENTRNCSTVTRNHRLSVISSFFKFASRKDLRLLKLCSEIIDIPFKKAPQKMMPYFTLEEIEILLGIPNPFDRLGRRDIVLLSLLYDSAARVQELCDLKVDDVKFGNPTKIVLVGKGGKGRAVPIMSKTASSVRQHILEHNYIGSTDGSKPLFSSQTREKMTRSCVANIVNKYVSLAKQKRKDLFRDAYSPHSFRHSKAVHMLEAGTELIYIRDFLGHKSINTTEVYAVVSQALIIKALKERNIPEVTPVLTSGDNIDSNKIPEFLRIRKRK